MLVGTGGFGWVRILAVSEFWPVANQMRLNLWNPLLQKSVNRSTGVIDLTDSIGLLAKILGLGIRCPLFLDDVRYD